MEEVDEFERQVMAAVAELLNDISRMRLHCQYGLKLI